MTETNIAIINRKAKYWSSDVAFIQGIHDYNDMYTKNKESQTQQVLLSEASSMFPLLPSPPTFVFDIESAKSLRKKRQLWILSNELSLTNPFI